MGFDKATIVFRPKSAYLGTKGFLGIKVSEIRILITQLTNLSHEFPVQLRTNDQVIKLQIKFENIRLILLFQSKIGPMFDSAIRTYNYKRALGL